jgi:4-nitrophenyl phosphatase
MIKDKLPNIKGLIIDMDGVLWHDTTPLGDLVKIFDRISELNLKFVLATNNATKTVDEVLSKLAKFGVELDEEQILNSAEATGIYLRENYGEGTVVYILGQPSLEETLRSYGMVIRNEKDDRCEVVVASLDYQLTYEKLKTASLLIQSGCEFVGTNADTTLPTPNGLIPGSGTVVSALEIASGRPAKIVGKPEPLLYQMALNRLGLAPEEVIAVGDRLETDIAGAQAAGIHTALVLTGVSTFEEAIKYPQPPEIIAKDLTELIFK